MKRLRYTAFAVVSAGVLWGVVSASAAEQKVIAVLDFDTIGVSSQLGRAASENLGTQLAAIKAFKVVERKNIDKVMVELQAAQTGLIDSEKAKEVGKLLGAHYLLVGSITKIGGTYTINARLVSVETGDTVMAKTAEFYYEDRMTEALKKLAAFLSEVEKQEQKGVLPADASKGVSVLTGVDTAVFRAALDRASSAIAQRLREIFPALTGKVTGSYHDENVSINIGEPQGVRAGQRFEVWGIDKVEGRHKKGFLVVMSVKGGKSMAKAVEDEAAMDLIDDGDEVTAATASVVIGTVADVDGRDDAVLSAFVEELKKAAGGVKTLKLVSSTELDAAVKSRSLKDLRKAGADVMIEGKLTGEAGRRSVNLQVVGLPGGETVSSIKFPTGM